MKKQLKIWKEDFLRYYSRTSVMMRIFIGAVLSLGIAFLLTQKVIKPQNARLKTLKQKWESMEVIDDVELQVADLKNKQRKISMQLAGLGKVNEKLFDTVGTLSQGEVGKNILDLRFLMDSCHLRIVSEERLRLRKTVSRRAVRKKVTDPRIKISFPSSMACESYQFHVLGSYQNLRRFFMAVRRTEALLFVNNVSVTQSKEFLTDKDFNQFRALACTFEVHVPYRRSMPAGGQKK